MYGDEPAGRRVAFLPSNPASGQASRSGAVRSGGLGVSLALSPVVDLGVSAVFKHHTRDTHNPPTRTTSNRDGNHTTKGNPHKETSARKTTPERRGTFGWESRSTSPASRRVRPTWKRVPISTSFLTIFNYQHVNTNKVSNGRLVGSSSGPALHHRHGPTRNRWHPVGSGSVRRCGGSQTHTRGVHEAEGIPLVRALSGCQVHPTTAQQHKKRLRMKNCEETRQRWCLRRVDDGDDTRSSASKLR